MKFTLLSELFSKLESTSKRLEKILILRDFFLENPKESPLIFDIIAGNYQRRINKKTIAISLKTVLSAISFVSKKSERNIEKAFNKIGDVGAVAQEMIEDKQQSLVSSTLTLQSILQAFENISRKTGKNSNKVKKEIISELFLQAEDDLSQRFLSRLMIDDLRVGVSEGVLKEAYSNAFFPQIVDLQVVCDNCKYVNLNMTHCFSCTEKLEPKRQKEIVKATLETSKERIKKNGKLPSKDTIIKTEDPRELYNYFLSLFELKYNLVNSFEIVHEELEKNRDAIFDAHIMLGIPLRSMLGPRSDNITTALETTGTPALADYKYDGLRVQIHNNKGDVELFSRNLDNITKQFPEVVEFVKENFSDLTFVADSECVGYDFDEQKFLPFQMLSRRILTKKVDTVSHIKVVVRLFDLMYLNGDTIITKPYEKRREMMQDLLLERPLTQQVSFNVNQL